MDNYDDQYNTNKGIIAWFTRNSVAANLLMVGIIIAGLSSAFTIKKQMFPQIENEWINVTVAYPGAAAREVEETITVKIEEALASIQGIERMITYSNRGSARANLKVLNGYDITEVLDEVKSSVDSISSFPDGIERPIVRNNKYRQEVMYITLSGDISQQKLKALGEKIHNEIRSLRDINVTDYYSGSSYEISIEVSKDKLREYNLNFSDIARSVRNFSTNRSAGQIRADEGFISVRVEEQAYIGAQFEQIPLRTLTDGTQLLLGDVATVNDGFEEGIRYNKINGKDVVTLFVGASKDQSITDISKIMHEYIDTRQATLPPSVTLEPWVDLTYYLNGRLNMMLSNMLYGGVLVFLILTLFLRTRLAFWVMMGLPVSFLGALAFLPLSWVDVTINVGSLFAFIMVLGVVVDDAIVIGESAHTEIEEKGLSVDNVIRGAQRVAMPATFGVLTTIAAFAPMVLESGPTSAFPNAIGYVVVLCLAFSLVESKLILPAHLAHMKPQDPNASGFLHRLRLRFDRKLSWLIEMKYQPLLRLSLFYRHTVLMMFIGIIFITASLFQGGLIRFVGTPKIPHDFSDIEIEMNANATEQDTVDALLKLQSMVMRVDEKIIEEFGSGIVDNVFIDLESRTSGEVQVKLVDPDVRPMDTFQLSSEWREVMPKITGLKRLTIRDSVFGGGGANNGDISYLLKSINEEHLKAVTEHLKTELSALEGVFEINDSEQDNTTEAQFSLKPLAYTMGLTTRDVASQASNSLYGLEAQRIVRDKEEIRVMVRYPNNERNAIGLLGELLIRIPNGKEVPLSEVADISFVEGTNQVYREDGNRAVTVYGSIDFDKTEPLKVAKIMKESIFPNLAAEYPDVKIEESGKLKNEREDLANQIRNIALILLPIYVLLALPLKSYTQPLMIMSVIPFGIIGAIMGHLILGMNMSSLSIFGIFAAIGVVVNDSLVMVDYINKAKARGEEIYDAVLHAGRRRFRAIVLTSLTTFMGLIPIISETSLQAKIVIPMAVSLAFGVLFSTVVTLFLVPCLYLIGNDLRSLFRSLRSKLSRKPPVLQKETN